MVLIDLLMDKYIHQHIFNLYIPKICIIQDHLHHQPVIIQVRYLIVNNDLEKIIYSTNEK